MMIYCTYSITLSMNPSHFIHSLGMGSGWNFSSIVVLVVVVVVAAVTAMFRKRLCFNYTHMICDENKNSPIPMMIKCFIHKVDCQLKYFTHFCCWVNM